MNDPIRQREEASLDEWRELYRLAAQYKKMKPWKTLANSDVIGISFSDEETGYFMILGNGGLSYGAYLFTDPESLYEVAKEARAHGYDFSDDYAAWNLKCISLQLTSRDEISEESMEIIRSLGLHFRGDTSWIGFETFEPGFYPSLPDQEEVRTAVRYLEILPDAIKARSAFVPRGTHLIGSCFMYKKEGDTWKAGKVMYPAFDNSLCSPLPKDQLLLHRVRKKRRLTDSWELDLILPQATVADEQYDRLLFPFMLILVNHSSGNIIAREILKPEQREEYIVQFLAEQMADKGRPATLLVDNPYLCASFRPFCEACRVGIEYGFLIRAEEVRRSLSDFMNNDYISLILDCLRLDISELHELAESMSEEDFNRMLVKGLSEALRPDDMGWSKRPSDSSWFEDDDG